MPVQAKVVIFLVLLLVANSVLLQSTSVNIQIASNDNADQKSSGFNQTELAWIRRIIKTAGSSYSNTFDDIARYIYLTTTDAFPAFWSVVVYLNQTENIKFYLTGQPDSSHTTKRYYQVFNPNNKNFTVSIFQVNNTVPISTKVIPQDHKGLQQHSKRNAELGQLMQRGFWMKSEQRNLNSLQFTKHVSPKVSVSQEAGIDLAMTTAYTWNKNIVDFTKVLQKLVETNLNQHWEVCVRFQSYNYTFGFLYTSPYDEWVEYWNYGLGSYVLRVFLYRNYING